MDVAREVLHSVTLGIDPHIDLGTTAVEAGRRSSVHLAKEGDRVDASAGLP